MREQAEYNDSPETTPRIPIDIESVREVIQEEIVAGDKSSLEDMLGDLRKLMSNATRSEEITLQNLEVDLIAALENFTATDPLLISGGDHISGNEFSTWPENRKADDDSEAVVSLSPRKGLSRSVGRGQETWPGYAEGIIPLPLGEERETIDSRASKPTRRALGAFALMKTFGSRKIEEGIQAVKAVRWDRMFPAGKLRTAAGVLGLGVMAAMVVHAADNKPGKVLTYDGNERGGEAPVATPYDGANHSEPLFTISESPDPREPLDNIPVTFYEQPKATPVEAAAATPGPSSERITPAGVSLRPVETMPPLSDVDVTAPVVTEAVEIMTSTDQQEQAQSDTEASEEKEVTPERSLVIGEGNGFTDLLLQYRPDLDPEQSFDLFLHLVKTFGAEKVFIFKDGATFWLMPDGTPGIKGTGTAQFAPGVEKVVKEWVPGQ